MVILPIRPNKTVMGARKVRFIVSSREVINLQSNTFPSRSNYHSTFGEIYLHSANMPILHAKILQEIEGAGKH